MWTKCKSTVREKGDVSRLFWSRDLTLINTQLVYWEFQAQHSHWYLEKLRSTLPLRRYISVVGVSYTFLEGWSDAAKLWSSFISRLGDLWLKRHFKKRVITTSTTVDMTGWTHLQGVNNLWLHLSFQSWRSLLQFWVTRKKIWREM